MLNTIMVYNYVHSLCIHNDYIAHHVISLYNRLRVLWCPRMRKDNLGIATHICIRVSTPCIITNMC